MSYFDELKSDIKFLVVSDSIKDSIDNIKKAAFSDTLSFIPYGQTLLTIVKAISDVPAMIFWSKLERFLRNVSEISYEDRQRFSQKFTEEGYEEYTSRLLLVINEIDAEQKIDIIANLTRALMQEKIDLNKYYRLLHSSKNTLFEDLMYLASNIKCDEFRWNINIISLMQSGLVYQSIIGNTEGARYRISSLGKELFCYGIEYDKIDENKKLLLGIDSMQNVNVVSQFS